MENQSVIVTKNELEKMKQMLKENEATKDIYFSKSELVILCQLEHLKKLLSKL